MAYQLIRIRAVYASFKTTGSLLLSVIVNRIELVRLPSNACAWHGRGINGRYWIRFPGATSSTTVTNLQIEDTTTANLLSASSTLLNDLPGSHYDLSGDYYANKSSANTFINDSSGSHYDLPGDYYTNKPSVNTFIKSKALIYKIYK